MAALQSYEAPPFTDMAQKSKRQMEQPERPSRKKDGGRDIRMGSAVSESKISSEFGASWTGGGEQAKVLGDRDRPRPSLNATAANAILFTKWAYLHEACHDTIAAHLY